MITKPMVATAATILAIVATIGWESSFQETVDAPFILPSSPNDNRIFATGVIEGASRTIEVRSEIPGRITGIDVQDGDWVSIGQVLGRLDDAEQRANVELAKSDLAMASAALLKLRNGARDTERLEARSALEAKQAEWEKADLTWRRIQALREDLAVSQEVADESRTNAAALRALVNAAMARLQHLESAPREDEVAMAQARVDSANARLQLSHVLLARTVIRSPSNATILSVDISAGEMVSPNDLQPIFRLADTRVARVRAYVEELDAPRVYSEMNADVKVEGLTGRTYQGEVVQVSPEMSRKAITTHAPTERSDTLMREVLIELSDARDLIIGLRVDVFLQSGVQTEHHALSPGPIHRARRIVPSVESPELP